MNRQRKSNRGLPARVYVKNDAYKFLAPEKIRDPADGEMKFWIKLSDVTEGEAAMLTALAALKSDKRSTEGTMVHLCAEFKANKLGKYTKQTQDQYSQYLDVIANDFEEFTAAQVTTKHCADFLRNNFSDKANTARKYSALLGKLFRYAIGTLGLRQDNPMDQIDLEEFEVSRREVLPTHEQVAAIRAAGLIGVDGKPTQSGPTFECIIDMTYLLWGRAIDIRMMKEAQIEDHVGGGGLVRMKPSKTKNSSGLAVDIVITPEIREVIERARAIKRTKCIISPYLFPTRKGTPYVKSGLNSMWDRAYERAADQAKKEGRDFGAKIQFKDLRALGATDAAKQGRGIAEIQNRLVHTSPETSQIYIKEAVPAKSAIDMGLPWKTR
nr:tyrosine-type recombinase/integrase [uncultured Massilia sp.]